MPYGDSHTRSYPDTQLSGASVDTARAADNFQIGPYGPVELCRVEAWMATNCPLDKVYLEIYENDCDCPENKIYTIDITDDVDLRLSGMDYDYSVDLRLDDNQRPLLELLVFSRLSLINSLIDYRAYATLRLDVGKRRWQVDVGTWKGEVDGGKTRSATVRFLNPLSETADIEFALGVDDSDLYDTVTIFSVFLYFYGGV